MKAIEARDRRYFLVCTEPLKSHWWCRFLKPGYRHCYVLLWEGAVWLYVDPTLYRTHVSILDEYEPTHPYDWIEDDDATVFEVIVDESIRVRAPWVVSPATCVEFSKAILGIGAFWVWTPWQLVKHILRRSAHGIRSEGPQENP